ncbi:MAG: DUF2520 domain-containing protein, partial [Myxococcota bacterium]
PEVWFLTLRDDVLPQYIPQIAAALPFNASHLTVVHCSGVTPRNILKPFQRKGASVGLMHPFQPVSGVTSSKRPFQNAFVGIEGQPQTLQLLEQYIRRLGGTSFSLAHVDRGLYHAAAVYSSNFLITLADIAKQLLQQAGVRDPIPLITSIMQHALNTLQQVGLPDALTGPFSRADHHTIQQHLQSIQRMQEELHENTTSKEQRVYNVYHALAQATIEVAKQQSPQKDFHTLHALLKQHHPHTDPTSSTATAKQPSDNPPNARKADE